MGEEKRVLGDEKRVGTETIDVESEQTNERVDFSINSIVKHFRVNPPGVFKTLETLTEEALSREEISTLGNALLRLPSFVNMLLNDSSTPSLRIHPRL